MYTIRQLIKQGVKLGGENIFINNTVKIYNPKSLIIGNNVRIDNFTILSGKGKIIIEDYTHISSSCFINSSVLVKIGKFNGLSSGVKVFGSNDDYSGEFLYGPTIPDIYKKIHMAPIILKDYCMIGANSIIMPNITLHEGCVVVPLSLGKLSLDSWKI